MANKEVNVTKRVVTSEGKRYCPVVLSCNGRIKPDYVYVNDKEERHPEGSYYIEWYEDGKRIRRSVEKDASRATARRQRQEQILVSKAMGIKVAEEGAPNSARPISDDVKAYLDEIKISRTASTYSAYNLALRNFTDSCPKTHLEEIDRTDLLQYVKHLRVRTCLSAPATIVLNTC